MFSISNEEPEPVSVRFVGGSLWTSDFTSPSPQGPRIVRNLTTTRYDLEIPAGQSESVQYKFATELQPQELKLNLAVVLTNSEGSPFTLQAFNETVAVVEPDTSIFDPQMYLHPFHTSLSKSFPTLSDHSLILLPITVSSSTSSSQGSSAVPASSSIIPGSPPSSRKSVVVAKTPRVPANPRPDRRRWIPVIKSLWLALMVPRSRVDQRPTMRVGFRPDICRDLMREE